MHLVGNCVVEKSVIQIAADKVDWRVPLHLRPVGLPEWAVEGTACFARDSQILRTDALTVLGLLEVALAQLVGCGQDRLARVWIDHAALEWSGMGCYVCMPPVKMQLRSFTRNQKDGRRTHHCIPPSARRTGILAQTHVAQGCM